MEEAILSAQGGANSVKISSDHERILRLCAVQPQPAKRLAEEGLSKPLAELRAEGLVRFLGLDPPQRVVATYETTRAGRAIIERTSGRPSELPQPDDQHGSAAIHEFRGNPGERCKTCHKPKNHWLHDLPIIDAERLQRMLEQGLLSAKKH